MPTRFALIEAQLVAERTQVWCDLVAEVTNGKDPSDPRISSLVARIRTMGEALGYPTDWRDIPKPGLSWYEMVEEAPEMGLHPLEGAPTSEGILPMDEHIAWFHGFSSDPDDPDDFDWEAT